jgi:hypothetical protein
MAGDNKVLAVMIRFDLFAQGKRRLFCIHKILSKLQLALSSL